jgi:membrane-associated phospholipid phosphatase
MRPEEDGWWPGRATVEPMRTVALRRSSWRVLAPRGPRDLAVQIGVFVLLAAVYAASGVFGRGQRIAAIDNGVAVDRLEHQLGIAWEVWLQHGAESAGGLFVSLANGTYFVCQFYVSSAFLLWVYARRTGSYDRIRNNLVGANIVAVLVSLIYPTAPPRLAGIGVADTLRSGAVSMQSSVVDALNNPYAAMPSLHISYAVAIGVAGVRLTRRRWTRLVWALYPGLVLYSIVVTGNHFVLDAVAGAIALAPAPVLRYLRQELRLFARHPGGRVVSALALRRSIRRGRPSG